MNRLIISSILITFIAITGCGIINNNGNPPQAVELSVKASTETSITLEWTKNDDTDFSQYRLYRSDSSGVDSNAELISTITQKDSLIYNDSDIPLHSEYYYKIYVEDSENLMTGSNEVSGAVAVNTTPVILLSPSKKTMLEDDAFIMKVYADGVTDLFGSSFEIIFDSEIKADSTIAGDFLGSDVVYFDNIAADTVSVAITRKAGDGGVDGYGRLCTIYFHAVSTGSTNINFTSDVKLQKEDGSPITDIDKLESKGSSITVN
ncbi:MAG: hypothetical protein SVK54_06190 [candidate division WOR-3 bacterium]|nr:hypothetical protein [candidate division WOR-3 bacterium]